MIKINFIQLVLIVCFTSILNAQTMTDADIFGPNMYIFSPTDDMAKITTTINTIHDEMLHDQFSTKRYAFYFKPGDYTQTGLLNIAYYTHIGGLGKLPTEVRLSNVYTPAPLPNNNATCTFWRSAENFTIAGTSTGDMKTWFQWAVSQAAPLRRINSERRAHYQWWYDGWCSGGFTGDCYFKDRAGSWSQQQWYFRNSYVELGSKDYSMGGWNLCYQGVEFGPTVNMANHSDNWTTSGGAWNNVSRVDKTPVIREKPFLFIGDDGRYKIFRPALRYDSKGTSWKHGNMGDGETFDLLNDFYVVKPGTSAVTMNEQLEAGKHLFITPGMYELSEPLLVKRANTIILGTGYATLIPSSANSTSAIVVDDVDGVTIASLLFDAHFSSRTLLQVGTKNATNNFSTNPTLLADLFFRVGGFRTTNVNVDIALEINSSDVIGDHFWIWRADHGQGVGWFQNTSKNGLVVNGHYVTIYGL
ncbi:MAG: glycosyl hydrolase family 28-related protein, partial [Paludibacter sp.]